MRKNIIAVIALCLSAVGAQAGTGYDLIVRLSKVSDTQLAEKSSIVPNGLTTHRWILYGPEQPTPSKHITPLGTSANFIVAGAPAMGTLTYAGSKYVSGGGGIGGKLHGPVLETSRQIINEAGVNYVRTVTTYVDGTINMTQVPESNGVLQEQAPQPMGSSSAYGNLSITISRNGGPNNGTSTTYHAMVPFMNVNSAVSVMHIAESNTYIVQSYQITVGGVTLSCNFGSLTATIDWFKDAKDH